MTERKLKERFGFIAVFDMNTELGDYYTVGQTELMINHDTQFVFLKVGNEWLYIGDIG